MIYRIEMLAVVICLGLVCMLPLQKIPVPDTPLRLKLPAVYPQNNIHIALGVAVYIPAGISQAMAQLGAISLISQQVHASVRAQANALFSLGGYIPAGIFSGISGFVIDLAGLTEAICLLSGLVSLLALGGGAFVLRSKI